MSTLGLIRRTAAAACGAFVLLAAVACQNALAQSGAPIRDIRVDVAPLRVNAGDPTASWVQQELPDQLAKAMAGRMSAHGGTLVVRIDYVALGPIKDSWSLDNIGLDPKRKFRFVHRPTATVQNGSSTLGKDRAGYASSLGVFGMLSSQRPHSTFTLPQSPPCAGLRYASECPPRARETI
jgi:hypothetical protein